MACRLPINVSLAEGERIHKAGLIPIASDCTTPPELGDTLVETHEGYRLYLEAAEGSK